MEGAGAPTIFDGRDVSAANLARIRAAYDADGVVCVRLLSAAKCEELVLEQWRHIIMRQPWTDEYKIEVHGEDGRVLDVDRRADGREFAAAVVGPLSVARRRQFEAGWPLHRGFGACCDPAVFHLEGVWSVRQDPDLYAIASAVCGEQHLWTTIDRSIQKLPGQGDDAFLHFDFNPLSAGQPQDSDATSGLRGKVCYTPSRFVCVPGTHTPAFLQDFAGKYAQHYPNVKPSDKKFGLAQERPDPLNLVARKRCLPVPSGCAIFWHPRLLHGQMKTPLTDPVEYGAYIGFFPAKPRPRYKAVSGIEEDEDRLRSYLEGTAPVLWPSFDKVQFYPKKFDNFPHLMKVYIDKLPPNHPMLATRVSPKGVTVTYLQPMALANYQPPALTPLGRKLLGVDAWAAALRASAGAAAGGAEHGKGSQRSVDHDNGPVPNALAVRGEGSSCSSICSGTGAAGGGGERRKGTKRARE